MFRNKISLSILGAVVLSLIVGGTIMVSSQNNQQNRADVSSSSGLKQKPENLRTPQNNGNQRNNYILQDIPEDVTYRQVFKHIEELNKKADDEEQVKRKDGKRFRNLYKKMARLEEKQARILDRIADKTNRQIKRLDERAKQITDQIRAQNPNRRIENGQKPPLPPQELFDLTKRRKEITLQGVNELRANLGEAEFVRFSQFVNEKVKTGIKKKGRGNLIQKGGRQR